MQSVVVSGGIDEALFREKNSSIQSYLSDALGSTIALYDASGTDVVNYTYSMYGITTNNNPGSSNAQQYTGRENDGDGLYYYRARYYSPGLQRFISQDPTGLAAGINRYAYVGGNPVSRTDRLGLMPDDSPGWDRWNQAVHCMSGKERVGFGTAAVSALVLGFALPAIAAGPAEIVVNIGGEGEIPGAINVQYPGALDATWGASRVDVGGKTLAELQALGE